MKIPCIFFLFFACVDSRSHHREKIDESALKIFQEDDDFNMNTLSKQDRMLFGKFKTKVEYLFMTMGKCIYI
jgi:hypothetical protein